MTTLPTAAPSVASALMPLFGTAGGLVALIGVGLIGAVGAMMM